MRPSSTGSRACPDAEIAEQITAKVFPDVVAFLRSVQQAGAVNSLAGGHYLSRSVLRDDPELHRALRDSGAGRRHRDLSHPSALQRSPVDWR
jgi:hypothetical protein